MVGHINRVRVVWDDSLGMATIVGFDVDLELVEMLFTSLLVQATGSGDRSEGRYRAQPVAVVPAGVSVGLQRSNRRAVAPRRRGGERHRDQ